MKIHFIAGLTRSGSTLLAGILKQNPAFIAGPTSPVMRVFQSVEYGTSMDNDIACSITGVQKRKLRQAVFTSMYWDWDETMTVFDKHQFWTAKTGILYELFPEAVIICCVRDVSWIMDSWERVYQSAPMELSKFFGFKSDTTVYIRCNKLAANDGAVGRHFDAFKEAYYGPHRDSLHIVEYMKLVTQPEAAMRQLYERIGEPYFAHDFKNVDMNFDQYDKAVGMPGLHKVRREVRFVPREPVLPPDLFQRYAGNEFWKTGSSTLAREAA